MLEQILRVLKENYDISGVKGDTVFAKEIDMDSLTLTSFIFDLEEMADVIVNPEEFENIETINDLVELISQKQANQ